MTKERKKIMLAILSYSLYGFIAYMCLFETSMGRAFLDGLLGISKEKEMLLTIKHYKEANMLLERELEKKNERIRQLESEKKH